MKVTAKHNRQIASEVMDYAVKGQLLL
jgi:hypothetical protein